ncbi:MAG: 50S ribosomal protein L22 [bacterium]
MQTVIYAKAKYVRKTPRKLRLIVNLIRGRNAVAALDILKFTNLYSAAYVLKVLNSAIRNAVYNNELDKTKLIIQEAYVDEAPVFKRGRAISRGRYHQILKRNSHIVIGVAVPSELEAKKTKTSVEKSKVNKEKVVKKKIEKPNEKKVISTSKSKVNK